MSRIFFTDRDLGKQFPAVLAAELAYNFVRSVERVEAFVAAHAAPFIAKVYRAAPGELAKTATAPGRVELWYPSR